MELSKKKIIASLLNKQDNIKFAFLFGSESKNKKRYGSDIDIAIYFDREPKLTEIGDLVIKLESTMKNKIDLVQLNNLDKSNPSLAHSILSSGIPLCIKDEASLKEFKRSVILYYLDFKFTLNLFNNAFNKRLSENKFAVFENDD